jgi:hypothetical protein
MSQTNSSALEHHSLHLLAGLEFHDFSFRDGNHIFRFVRITANTGLPYAYLEDSEITEFHVLSLDERFGDIVEALL